MRLRLALFLPAHFYRDAYRISKQLHSLCIAVTNEHGLARRSWSLCPTPSYSVSVSPRLLCFATAVCWCCSSVWSFFFFFLTVKHQHNEVLPGFGIGVSSAKLTRWEISVFSCWQSIYLPSNVEYVCGMNTEWHEKMEEEKEVDIAVCEHSFSHWEMLLSGELHNSPRAITLPWIIQSHMSLEPISIDTRVNVKTSTKGWHDFFHFHTSAVVRYLFFYFVLVSQIWSPCEGGVRLTGFQWDF